VGRKREMSQAIDRLLPLPVGTHRFSESGEHRLVTLTKEGGIGKTGLACQVTDWACERGLFPGGVVGIGCEQFINGQQLVSQLLTLLGLPPESQNGDPLDMLKVILPQIIQSQPSLFILDNLDQLIGRHIAPETSDYTDKFLQTLLNISPEIRVLATSRSPLGLGDHEFDLEVPPMDIEEAKDVFVSYLDSPIHRLEVEKLWEQPKSLIHELVEMSGYHPLSLKLLAFQMKRPGLSFEKLLSEAKSDLMDVLTDPYSSDEDKNRLRKVRNSYELSYKNLSGEGKRLFERMSFFPGGVFTGGPVDLWIKWDELLGENWREIMERELDYFGLVHYEPDGHHGNLGSFIMLNPMLEFAKSKYSQERNETWEKDWTKFWQERIELWDAILSGKLPSDLPGDFDQKKEMAVFLRQIAKLIFAKTQLNWLKNFDHCLNLKSNLTKDLLLHTVDFCSLSGQLTLLRTLSEKTVQLFRDTADEANLAPCLGTLGNVLGDLGDLDEAHTSYEEALNLYRKFAKQHPKTFEPFVGNTLNNLGVVLDGLGDPNEACTAYGEALEIRRKFAKQAPEAYEPGVAMTLNNLGVVLRDLGDPSGARTAYQEALDLYRKFAEQHPEAYEPDVAMTLNNLGILRRELGDPNGARTAFQEALDLYRKFAKQHPEAYEPDVAMTLDNLGIVLSDSGDSSGARAAFEVALEIRRKFAKQHPAAYEPAFASTFNNLGNVLRDLGDRDGARAAFEEAMRILSPFFERLPQAFVGDFVIFLRNYISITKETPDDLWWNLWKELQEKAKVEEMAQAETE
jgi:tetratricopeptide (TPR) repeat protein